MIIFEGNNPEIVNDRFLHQFQKILGDLSQMDDSSYINLSTSFFGIVKEEARFLWEQFKEYIS